MFLSTRTSLWALSLVLSFCTALPQVSALIPFFENGKAGYLDDSLQWQIPPRYDRATVFFHGVALVAQADDQFFIDREGTRLWTLGPEFIFRFQYSSGYYLLEDQEQQYFLFDSKGHQAYGPFMDATPVYECKAFVKEGSGDPRWSTYSILDTATGTLTPTAFGGVTATGREGVFRVYSAPQRGLVDSSGRFLARYDELGPRDPYVANALGYWLGKEEEGAAKYHESTFFRWNGQKIITVQGMVSNSSSALFGYEGFGKDYLVTRFVDTSIPRHSPIEKDGSPQGVGAFFLRVKTPGRGEDTLYNLDGSILATHVLGAVDFGTSVLYWNQKQLVVRTEGGKEKRSPLDKVPVEDLLPQGDPRASYYLPEAMK